MKVHPAVAAYFGESGKLWRMLGVRADPDETKPVVRARPRAGLRALSVKRARARDKRRRIQRASRRRNRG
jgi:hypothetical protein